MFTSLQYRNAVVGADRNTATATHRNLTAVDYECTFSTHTFTLIESHTNNCKNLYVYLYWNVQNTVDLLLQM